MDDARRRVAHADPASSLYTYINNRRQELGWTLAETAAKAGVDRNIFGRMQHGRRIDDSSLRGFAQALRVPVAELLVRMGYTPEELGVAISPEPRPPSRVELMDMARSQLTSDELVSLVRERMTRDGGIARGDHGEFGDALDDEDVLDANGPAQTVEVGGRELTGRRRPERGSNGSSTSAVENGCRGA